MASVHIYGATINANHLRQRIERKFFVLPKNIGLAYGLLQHVCRLDREYPSEQINSLYFDTADLDQHEKSSSGDYRKDKVRIRWYGEDEDLNGRQAVFLELKSRRGFASTKQRLKLEVPAENLAPHHLGKGIVARTLLADTLARFGYFSPEPLQPVIRISYWRYRFTEMLTGMRVALDCYIRSTMIIPGSGNGEHELDLSGGVVEVKGTSIELPITLRHMKFLDLDWSRFSKYSSCIDSHNEGIGTIGRLSPSGKIIQL